MSARGESELRSSEKVGQRRSNALAPAPESEVSVQGEGIGAAQAR